MERDVQPHDSRPVFAIASPDDGESFIVGRADGTPGRFLEPGEELPAEAVIVKAMPPGLSLRDLD